MTMTVEPSSLTFLQAIEQIYYSIWLVRKLVSMVEYKIFDYLIDIRGIGLYSFLWINWHKRKVLHFFILFFFLRLSWWCLLNTRSMMNHICGKDWRLDDAWSWCSERKYFFWRFLPNVYIDKVTVCCWGHFMQVFLNSLILTKCVLWQRRRRGFDVYIMAYNGKSLSK